MEAFLVLASSLLTPILVSWLKDHHWPDWAKVLLTLGISIGAGALIAATEGRLNPHNTAGTAGVIFALAVTFYKTSFQSSQLNQQLEGTLSQGSPDGTPSQVSKGTHPATFVRPSGSSPNRRP